MIEDLLPYGDGPDWKKTLTAVRDWTLGKAAPDLFRINPLAVSRERGTGAEATTDVFLAGVLEGWFDLRWDYHCPHCRGIPDFSAHLHDAKVEGFCPLCNVGFRNELDSNVEVTFTATPKLATYAPGEEESLLMAYNQAPGGRNPLAPGQFLSGLDVLHRPLFHERFSDDVLSAEESLAIRHVAILFTDIKGSTRLYEELGDSAAYRLVREHFKVLFSVIEARHGVVVKTIGDAVMGSFRSPADALLAALEGQKKMEALKVPGSGDAVIVKMGLHAGPAIAVTLNDRFDYFGQTVNRAARIQGLAGDRELFFSEAVLRDTAVRRALAPLKARVRKWSTRLRGIEGQQVVFSIS
jgi:class 3 adenylate cyclase